MKNWVVIPLVTFLFSLSFSAAHSELNKPQSFFITHKQFMNLTPSEQKTYVKKLKEMVVEMSTTFPYFAEEMSARSSLFEQLWRMNTPIAIGKMSSLPDDNYLELYAVGSAEMAKKYSDEINKTRITSLSVKQKAALVEKYRQSLYWSAAASGAAHHIRDPKKRETVVNQVSAPNATMVLSNEDKINMIGDPSEHSEVRKQYLDKAVEGKLSILEGTFPKTALVSYGEKLSSSKVEAKKTEAISAPQVEKPAAAPAPPAPPKKETPTVIAKEKEKDKEVSLPIPVPPGKMNPSEPTAGPLVNSYRCMYAGFIIKNDPCIAPRELPWELDGIGEDFTCDEGTVMCNPFMFGFKSEVCGWADAIEKGRTDKCWSGAKPHCVKPGLYATKTCTDMSNNDDSLQAAVEVIRRNEIAFNELGNSFEDLCSKNRINWNSYPRKKTAQNIERTKTDIKRTCKVAALRMAEIEKRYGITKSPDFPPGPKGKELMKVNKDLKGKDLLMWKPGKKNDGSK